jgi:hypothetical protein
MQFPETPRKNGHRVASGEGITYSELVSPCPKCGMEIAEGQEASRQHKDKMDGYHQSNVCGQP